MNPNMDRLSPDSYAVFTNAAYNPIYTTISFVVEQYLKKDKSIKFVFFKGKWRTIESAQQDKLSYDERIIAFRVKFSGLKERRFNYGATCWLCPDRGDVIRDIENGRYWFQNSTCQIDDLLVEYDNWRGRSYKHNRYRSPNQNKVKSHPNYLWFRNHLTTKGDTLH